MPVYITFELFYASCIISVSSAICDLVESRPPLTQCLYIYRLIIYRLQHWRRCLATNHHRYSGLFCFPPRESISRGSSRTTEGEEYQIAHSEGATSFPLLRGRSLSYRRHRGIAEDPIHINTFSLCAFKQLSVPWLRSTLARWSHTT